MPEQDSRDTSQGAETASETPDARPDDAPPPGASQVSGTEPKPRSQPPAVVAAPAAPVGTPPAEPSITPAALLTTAPEPRLSSDASRAVDAQVDHRLRWYGSAAALLLAVFAFLGYSSVANIISAEIVRAIAQQSTTLRDEAGKTREHLVNATLESRTTLAQSQARLETTYERALERLQAREDAIAKHERDLAALREGSRQTLEFLEASLDRGVAMTDERAVKVASALLKTPAFLGHVEAQVRGVPIGTVLTSVLTPEEFAQLSGERGFDPRASAWALADGRSVEGSRFTTITLRRTVPDLRGLFLRGHNDGRSDGRQDPGPREADGYQAFANLMHDHPQKVAFDEGAEISARDRVRGLLRDEPERRYEFVMFNYKHALDWWTKRELERQGRADPEEPKVHRLYALEAVEFESLPARAIPLHVKRPRYHERTGSDGASEARPQNYAIRFYVRIN